MTYYKFVSWEPQDIEKVLTAHLPQAMIEYDNGNKKPLIEYYHNNSNPELLHNARFKLGGWMFITKEYCKRYWANIKHYGILQVYAPDKTSIRTAYGKHNVIEIIEM